MLSIMTSTGSQTGAATFDATGSFFIPPNPNRIALLINSALAAQMIVFPFQGTSLASGGTIMLVGARPMLLHALFHGDLVRQQTLVTGTVGDVFTYSEVLIGAKKWG